MLGRVCVNLQASSMKGGFSSVSKYVTVSTWELSRLLSKPDNKAYLTCVVQHQADSNVIVGACTERMIHVLDVVKGGLIHSYAEHSGRVSELCFSRIETDPDLVHVFFSASEDHTIKIWDSRVPTAVTTLGTVLLQKALPFPRCERTVILHGLQWQTVGRRDDGRWAFVARQGTHDVGTSGL